MSFQFEGTKTNRYYRILRYQNITWASTSLSISCTTVQTSWMVFLIPILRSPTWKRKIRWGKIVHICPISWSNYEPSEKQTKDYIFPFNILMISSFMTHLRIQTLQLAFFQDNPKLSEQFLCSRCLNMYLS